MVPGGSGIKAGINDPKNHAEIEPKMRAALKDLGVPEDVLQCVGTPSIPLANELMSVCDLTIATGGPAMVTSVPPARTRPADRFPISPPNLFVSRLRSLSPVVRR